MLDCLHQPDSTDHGTTPRMLTLSPACAMAPSHNNIRWTEPLVSTIAMTSPTTSDASAGSRPASPSAVAPLSTSLPAQRPRRHHRGPHMRRYHSQSPNSPAKPPLLSASIPLPKSHIRRTPSELQLADDVARAEYEDVRMYARLVVGMQSRCREAGYVHPLTKKSLQDILKTKQARQEELERHQEEEEEGGWGLSHERDEDDASVDTPRPCQPLGTEGKAPSLVKTPSQGSVASELSQAEREDECVFSLEL